jgi:Flp pilus assembly protein CpaB
MNKSIIVIAIIIIAVVIIGYLVASYFDRSAVVERAMEEAEESEIEIQQALIECRNTLTNAGMDPIPCNQRAEQARQQINEFLNQ